MLNVVALVGRLTANPELKHTANAVPVARFSVAVSRSFARQGEERQTDFFDIVVFRTTAEFLCKYFTKGQLIAVEGTLQTRTYQDSNGNNRKVVEVIASGVHFVESKNSDRSSAIPDELQNEENISNNNDDSDDDDELPF